MDSAARRRSLVERPGCGVQYAMKVTELDPDAGKKRKALQEVRVPAVTHACTVFCAHVI